MTDLRQACAVFLPGVLAWPGPLRVENNQI